MTYKIKLKRKPSHQNKNHNLKSSNLLKLLSLNCKNWNSPQEKITQEAQEPEASKVAEIPEPAPEALTQPEQELELNKKEAEPPINPEPVAGHYIEP